MSFILNKQFPGNLHPVFNLPVGNMELPAHLHPIPQIIPSGWKVLPNDRDKSRLRELRCRILIQPPLPASLSPLTRWIKHWQVEEKLVRGGKTVRGPATRTCRGRPDKATRTAGLRLGMNSFSSLNMQGFDDMTGKTGLDGFTPPPAACRQPTGREQWQTQ